MSAAERELRSGLSGLYAVAERYPDLKANDAFKQLQTRISALETAIADRREVYNDSVNANNVRIQAFPDLLVARLGSFPEAQMLEFDADEGKDVDLKALFTR